MERGAVAKQLPILLQEVVLEKCVDVLVLDKKMQQVLSQYPNLHAQCRGKVGGLVRFRVTRLQAGHMGKDFLLPSNGGHNRKDDFHWAFMAGTSNLKELLYRLVRVLNELPLDAKNDLGLMRINLAQSVQEEVEKRKIGTKIGATLEADALLAAGADNGMVGEVLGLQTSDWAGLVAMIPELKYDMDFQAGLSNRQPALYQKLGRMCYSAIMRKSVRPMIAMEAFPLVFKALAGLQTPAVCEMVVSDLRANIKEKHLSEIVGFLKRHSFMSFCFSQADCADLIKKFMTDVTSLESLTEVWSGVTEDLAAAIAGDEACLDKGREIVVNSFMEINSSDRGAADKFVRLHADLNPFFLEAMSYVEPSMSSKMPDLQRDPSGATSDLPGTLATVTREIMHEEGASTDLAAFYKDIRLLFPHVEIQADDGRLCEVFPKLCSMVLADVKSAVGVEEYALTVALMLPAMDRCGLSKTWNKVEILRAREIAKLLRREDCVFCDRTNAQVIGCLGTCTMSFCVVCACKEEALENHDCPAGVGPGKHQKALHALVTQTFDAADAEVTVDSDGKGGKAAQTEADNNKENDSPQKP